MSREPQEKSFATLAIHGGEKLNEHGGIMPSIDLSTTFVQKKNHNNLSSFEYTRTGNPTRKVLETLFAQLEKSDYGLAFSSGMAAATSIIHLLKSGDHIISVDNVYGGTHRFFKTVVEKVYGMKVTFLNLSLNNNEKENETILENTIKSNISNTKLLWLETPSNPTLKIVNIKNLSKIAHSYNMLVVVDNTWASPYNQNPLILGADIVYHSATKYINGHSDVLLGLIAINNNNNNLYNRLKTLQNTLGNVPSPFDCYLAIRGIKTLNLRMEKHYNNAIDIANYLSKNKYIKEVIYPGLSTHPQYDIIKKQMKTPGGMMSMYINGDINSTLKFLNNLKVFFYATSLGGVESLAEHPATRTHLDVPKNEREKLGITDNLVRLSIGCEDVNDLISDLDQALNKSFQNNECNNSNSKL